MRYLVISAFMCACLLVLTSAAFGQGTGCGTGADAGKRNGIYYTDCFPWASGDGTLTVDSSTVNNDTGRLGRAIAATHGKLVFNEVKYHISDTLDLHSHMIIEGTSTNTSTAFVTSYIRQTQAGKSIFRIAPGTGTDDAIEEIAIRDIGLRGTGIDGSTGNYGIYATGGASNKPGLYFQFSNIRFRDFNKGIYVNATDTGGGWQFDNVRLDRCTFENNKIGVHVNSMNSGWSITSIDMKVPVDATGFYFERSTYTSLNMVIGNGPNNLAGTLRAGPFIKIERHGNISIQNAVSEGFSLDLVIDGIDSSTRNFPVALINNHFMHGVTIKGSTVMSTGNQFGYYDPVNSLNKVAVADVTGDSVVYSVGDKFCFQGQTPCTLSGNDYSKYRVTENSRLVTIGGNNNSISLGQEGAGFDISRSETDGTLTFKSTTPGFGFTFDSNYSNVKIKDANLNFSNGTITLGSAVFVNLSLGTQTNGTLYYCWDCKANATTGVCEGSGTGAIAKRINGAWICN